MNPLSDYEPAAWKLRDLELADLEPFWPSAPPRPREDLQASIAELGLIRPLWVLEEGGRLKILAGARRRAALLALGRRRAPALTAPPELPRERLLALALADNLQRGLNPAETALIWRFLQDQEPALAPRLAPQLGLGQSPRLRAWSYDAAALPDKGLAALADDRLDLENAARLAGWEAESRDKALDLFERLRPSKQKKREWLNWLEDLARREKSSPARILGELEAEPEIRAACEDLERLGRSKVEELFRRRLWRRRHPILNELLLRREARRAALALPQDIRLELDPGLEDLEFNLRLSFTGPADFERQLKVLAALAAKDDFKRLLDDADG
ncbi:MAG: ParB N-terminal domain-containing protein [Candidatus Adiutrix sp.]|nr:ParB N-terminal domain-containing protein [Candidatus Adiutrix sp.]